MRKRILRLSSFSDDDDDPSMPQSINSPSTNPRPSLPHPNAPYEISDDELMEVEASVSERSSVLDSEQSVRIISDGFDANTSDHASSAPIDEFLRGVGLALRREWLSSCLSSLRGVISGIDGLNVGEKARMCFEQFLLEDMNYCGAGILPENVHCMDKVELKGPFVLQVDEISNISRPLRERYHDTQAGFKRCLKLSMTDGVQHVFGMEYRPIKDLNVLSLAGLKIIIRNVQIRRGLLLLLPEVLEVLGGMVEDLDAARQRVISEINKPPRGKRNLALLTLHQRATVAAWPSNTVNSNPAHTVYDNDANTSESNINNNGSQANISVPPNLSNPQLVQDTRITSETVAGRPIEESFNPSAGRENFEGLVHNDIGGIGQRFDHTKERCEEEPAYDSRLNNESSSGTDTAKHVQEGNAMDVDDAVYELNPIILTGGNEIPFTYLACLLAKWSLEKGRTSFIQGRIKCILTGVKRFQFKQRRAYELIVYIDDGSHISEVSIDHNVVQSGIGFSPEDVTAALSSSQKREKADMTDAMKKYQLFLSVFEGIIHVEINNNSPLPVVLEMSQGCPASDAWLLLRRLKSFTSRNL